MKLAETSECRKRHGAIIVRSGSVLGMGVNRQKNNPTIVDADSSPWHCGDHAEIAALKRVKNTKGATLYVARVLASGQPTISKPCKNCKNAIDSAGIKKVVWTV